MFARSSSRISRVVFYSAGCSNSMLRDLSLSKSVGDRTPFVRALSVPGGVDEHDEDNDSHESMFINKSDFVKFTESLMKRLETKMDGIKDGMDVRMEGIETELSKVRSEIGEIYEELNRQALKSKYGEGYAAALEVKSIRDFNYLRIGDTCHTSTMVVQTLSATSSLLSFLKNVRSIAESLKDDPNVSSSCHEICKICDTLEVILNGHALKGKSMLDLYQDAMVCEEIKKLYSFVSTVKRHIDGKFRENILGFLVPLVQMCVFFEKLRREGGKHHLEEEDLFCDSPVTLSVLASHFNDGNHQWPIEFDHRGEAFVIGKEIYVIHGESKKSGGKSGYKQLLFRSKLLKFVCESQLPKSQVYCVGITHVSKGSTNPEDEVTYPENIKLTTKKISEVHNSLMDMVKSEVEEMKKK